MKPNILFFSFLLITISSFTNIQSANSLLRISLENRLSQNDTLATNSVIEKHEGVSNAAYPSDPQTTSQILGDASISALFADKQATSPTVVAQPPPTPATTIAPIPITAIPTSITSTSQPNSAFKPTVKTVSSPLLNREAAVVIPAPISPAIKTCPQHGALETPETSSMRFRVLLILIIWGTIYFILRLLLSSIKSNSDTFVRKSIKKLAHQTILLYICVSVLICIYTLGEFDSYPFNGEFFLNGLGMFVVFWVIFNILLIYFCDYQNKRIKDYENGIKNKTISQLKAIYEKSFDTNNNKKKDEYLIELLEYKLLKYNFIYPIYPTFKTNILGENFNFSKYLEISMIQKLNLFFKFSWTCWIITIFSIFLWSLIVSTVTFDSFVKILFLIYRLFLLF